MRAGLHDVLKSVQFYRKVHDDFTEATAATGVISILAALAMVFLFFSQLSEFLSVHEDTAMVLDDNTSDKLQINFNVTMQFLPCRFASVDVSDAHGDHGVNITTHIAKWRIVSAQDGEHERLAAKPELDIRRHDRTNQTPTPTPTPTPELDVYNDSDDNAVEITPENFDELLSVHDLALVNFFAPWCIWSQRLKPVWEHTAGFFKDNKRVLLGRCDCSKPHNRPLCQRNHIMAFPTIRVFRLGATHSHEYYSGDRQTSALLDYVRTELDGLHDTVVPGSVTGEVELGGARFQNVGKETFEDTARGPEGCMLTGFVQVNRAPGNFHIQARATDHSTNVDALNTTHLVTSLTFGTPLSPRALQKLGEPTAGFVNSLKGRYFVANTFGATREHYLKVVHTSVHPLGAGRVVSTYQYTSSDTEFEEHPPSAKFSFDLEPTKIVVRRRRQPFTTFLTSVCAIVGGVFTVIGLVDSVLYHSLNVLRKQRMGKLG